MNCALLSDVHAEPALKTVLAEIERRAVDEVWFIGDVLGYGEPPNYGQPAECVKLLREYVRPDAWVIGNHDAACVGCDPAIPLDRKPSYCDPNEAWWGLLRGMGFNRDAVSPLRAHWEAIRDSNIVDFLRSLPAIAQPMEGCVLVHGGLRDKLPLFSYIHNDFDADLEYKKQEEGEVPSWQWLIAGHTHLPALFQPAQNPGLYFCDWYGPHSSHRIEQPNHSLVYDEPFSLGDKLAIINPGSIGQARDDDGRPAYAILDTEACTVTFYRVSSQKPKGEQR